MSKTRRAVLTNDMKRMVTELRLCYVATVTSDGKPNLSPKGTLKVLDDDHLVFADIASPGTIENLRHNPFIEINIVDPILRRGYRFKGKAEIVTDDATMSFVGSGLGHEYPIRQAVKVRVEETFPVRSPVYTYTKLSEAEIRDSWLKNYGYRLVDVPKA